MICMETADPLVIIPESHRRLTVRDYHLMIDAGVFDEDDHIELLEGVLVDMTPQSGPHAWAIQVLTGLLVRAVGVEFDVRVQLPLTVSETSEPEPDFAVVRAGERSGEHPRTALLVVEISRGSLKRDRAVKVPLYARANVPEYWIVNLDKGEIEVFVDPDAASGRYRRARTVRREDQVTSETLPAVTIAVAALLVPPGR